MTRTPCKPRKRGTKAFNACINNPCSCGFLYDEQQKKHTPKVSHTLILATLEAFFEGGFKAENRLKALVDSGASKPLQDFVSWNNSYLNDKAYSDLTRDYQIFLETREALERHFTGKKPRGVKNA